MSSQYRRRVGSVRPSHLMFTSGVGALVDLPNFSVLVRGLDDWNYDGVPVWEPIDEPRLLNAVQRLLRDRGIKELRPAPWRDGLDTDPKGAASRVGVPVTPFPGWFRCTACDELAALGTQVFAFENDKARRPQDARFYHPDCRKKKNPLAVPARFVLACTAGHLDEFPYAHFVHHGITCPKGAEQPRLQMEDRGGNIGANVSIRCLSCGERRNIREALGQRGEQHLPRCRGRHPQLGTFTGDCDRQLKVLVIGASNQWFPQTLSALAVPEARENELSTMVAENWHVFESMPGREMLPYLRGVVPGLHRFEKWSDDELWAAVEKQRNASNETTEEEIGYPDLRTAEWQAFSSTELPPAGDDFTLRRDPCGVPVPLRRLYSDVVQVERLREVRALTGFTRLDAPDPEDPQLVTRAPLARFRTTWVPASEVRGEGIFLRVSEEALSGWEQRVEESEALRRHRRAYGHFRRNRYSDRIDGRFDEMKNWPGARYIALHTLSHLLIRTIALECGYSSASLSERIYVGDEDDPRGGILIYTAVPDAEGTLGGLVSQAEPHQLERITRRALHDAMQCSSDPLCGERLPQPYADYLHGAACHVCLFVSETTCERGNRFLDRRFVVPIDTPELALIPELP